MKPELNHLKSISFLCTAQSSCTLLEMAGVLAQYVWQLFGYLLSNLKFERFVPLQVCVFVIVCFSFSVPQCHLSVISACVCVILALLLCSGPRRRLSERRHKTLKKVTGTKMDGLGWEFH